MNEVLAAHAGQVRYQVIHKPLPFHRRAPDAMRAALAAGQQGKFWQMHDLLLANQTALEAADIEGYAKKIGLDLARFRTDLAGATVNNQADLEEANAQSLKVEGVPAFFFNGRPVQGAQPRAVFEQALAEELAYADAVLKAGVPASELYNTITKTGATQLSAGPPRPAPEPDAKPTPDDATFRAAHQVLIDHAATARACYDEALALRPGLAGKVIVDLRIARGQPPRVLLHESTMSFPKVDNCIVQALKKLTYPEGTEHLINVRHMFAFP
jgi:hypothetical protein